MSPVSLQSKSPPKVLRNSKKHSPTVRSSIELCCSLSYQKCTHAAERFVMEPSLILLLILAAIVMPLMWWLMWREDFDGTQSEWRYRHECKSRDYLSPIQFYEQFYQPTDVQEDSVLRLLSLHADFWQVDPRLIRPHDDYCRIFGNAFDAEFIYKIESEFGISISDDDLATLDGTFDSIARYVDMRVKPSA